MVSTFEMCKVGVELRCPVYEADKGPWFTVKVVEIYQDNSIKVELVDTEEKTQGMNIGEQFILLEYVVNKYYRKVESKIVEMEW